MPAAPAAPKETAEQAAEKAAVEQWKQVVEAASEGDTPAARQVRRAIALEQQLHTIRTRIDDNRTYLRLMDRNEELNEAQAEFTDTFYPEKEKGERRSADEVAATRRAKAHARSNGAGE